MLKLTHDNETDIPEALRSYYENRDGKFHLKVEGGAVATAKLNEFRERNIELQKLNDKFKDVDPAEYQRLKAIEADLAKGKLDGKAAELVEARVSEMKKAHEKAVAELTTERDNARKDLAGLRIGEAAITAAMKLGLRKTASDDLTARVSRIFTLGADGKPVATIDGKSAYNERGEPLAIDDYVKTLTKTAEHLFDSSSGSGSGGANGTGGAIGGGKNPWKAESFNLTEQGKITKSDPALAARLKSEAGVK